MKKLILRLFGFHREPNKIMQDAAKPHTIGSSVVPQEYLDRSKDNELHLINPNYKIIELKKP